MSIWDDEQVDWTTGDGLRTAQLFERAYGDREAARAIADEVGLTWPEDASSLGHSELWVALLSAAARDRRLLELAADLLGDSTRRDFSTPLRQVLGEQLGAANAQRVSRHGLPRSTDEATAVIASLDLASTAEALLPTSGGRVESINDAGGGLLPLGAVIQVFLEARRRVALVRRGLAPVGTGFLVGPDLLLTAAHVVRPRGEPQPDDLEGLDVVFDFYEQGRSITETGTKVPVAELLRASPATDQELDGSLLASWDAPGDRLDYALLRLGRHAGEDATTDTVTRGWYRLETVEADLTRSSLVSVYHFPLGEFLTWSLLLGSFEFNPGGTKTRMRYRTNTLPGSSGAPIVDGLGRLLGVHHYGTKTQNQAIPVWRVAEAVKDLMDAAPAVPAAHPAPAVMPGPAIEKPKPYDVLQVGPRPLVGRNPLRGKLWTAMTKDDAAKSLVIVGSTDSGITWSYWLLSHMAAQGTLFEEVRERAPQGVEAIRVDLREDIAKPAVERRAALIRAVTRRIASEITDEWVAQAARQVSDFKDWCYQQLAGSERQWWIFVDSIDEKGDVDQHGMGEVLAALVDLADDPQVNLRLVLAGRQANTLSHGSLQWAETDTPVGLTREEVKDWLEARAEQTGRTARADLVEGFLNRWFGATSQAARPVELTLALPAAVAEVSP